MTHQAHNAHIDDPHQPESVLRDLTTSKEECKHEWGSEDYRSDGKAFYECNKCDATME